MRISCLNLRISCLNLRQDFAHVDVPIVLIAFNSMGEQILLFESFDDTIKRRPTHPAIFGELSRVTIHFKFFWAIPGGYLLKQPSFFWVKVWVNAYTDHQLSVSHFIPISKQPAHKNDLDTRGYGLS